MKKIYCRLHFADGVCGVCPNTEQTHVECSNKKISDSLFSITATTAIPEGWNLYAPDANTEGLQETVILPPITKMQEVTVPQCSGELHYGERSRF